MTNNEEIHIVESVLDTEKFRVIVSRGPSGSRFQWAVAYETEVSVGASISARELYGFLCDQVVNG